MKILSISEFYPPTVRGGAEISTSILNNALSKLCTVEVMTQNFVKKNSAISAYRILLPITLIDSSTFNIIKFILFGMTLYPIANAFILNKLLIKNKYDMIHIVLTNYLLIPLLIVPVLRRIPIVIDIRNGSVLCINDYSKGQCINPNYKLHKCFLTLTKPTGIWSGYMELLRLPFAIIKYVHYLLYRHILKLIVDNYISIKLVAVSKYIQYELTAFGYCKRKIIVIPNALAEHKVQRIRKENSLVYAGRIESEKGIWVLLQAVRELRKRNNNILVKIIGDGYEHKNVLKYINATRDPFIKAYGHISHERTLSEISKAKIIIAPSLWPEPFGRFIQDSFSCGTPLICSDVGGVRDAISHHKTGILVKKNDPIGLADAIDKLLNNSVLYENILSNIKVTKRLYQTRRIVHLRLSLYKSMILK